jgi:hypothetical protein
MAYAVGRLCTFPFVGAPWDERRFQEEGHGTIRQGQRPAKHPLAGREHNVTGEWDQLSRISIEQHGGG